VPKVLVPKVLVPKVLVPKVLVPKVLVPKASAVNNTSKPASKNPIICVKFSIKNAATYQQKSKNPKIF